MLISDIPNFSLVAFYGDKPPQLRALIQKLQIYLANLKILQGKFIPYQLEQVHGTIIGCEGIKTELGVISKWFYQRRKEPKYVDFLGLINYLQHQIDFPLTIRFGGYDRDKNYDFLSRNQHPYFRSFQLQPSFNQAIPVLIGWSWENDTISLGIDNLRRNLQQFNLLHKYHQTPNAIDNDFYLRLGTIRGELNLETIQAIASDIRNILATPPALDIPLHQQHLAFAQYQDLSLTPQTTKIISVAEITPDKINKIKRLSPVFR